MAGRMDQARMPQHILIALEDPEFALALADALRAAGHEPLRTNNADVAISATIVSPPDIVLLDARASVLERLTSPPSGKGHGHLSYALLCTSEAYAALPAAVTAHAQAHIATPAHPADCLPAILTALRRAREMSQLRDRERQLSNALSERRHTSMAVGVFMERLRLDRRKAFETLRNGARAHGRHIASVAADLLDAIERSNGLFAAKRCDENGAEIANRDTRHVRPAKLR